MKLFVSRLSDECEFSREKSVAWAKIVQSCLNLLVDFYNNLLIFKILACNHCTPPAIPQTLAGATSRLPARCTCSTSCTLPPPCLVVGVTWWTYGRAHQLPLWSAAWGGYCVVFLLFFTYSCQPRFRSGGGRYLHSVEGKGKRHVSCLPNAPTQTALNSWLCHVTCFYFVEGVRTGHEKGK